MPTSLRAEPKFQRKVERRRPSGSESSESGASTSRNGGASGGDISDTGRNTGSGGRKSTNGKTPNASGDREGGFSTDSSEIVEMNGNTGGGSSGKVAIAARSLSSPIGYGSSSSEDFVSPVPCGNPRKTLPEDARKNTAGKGPNEDSNAAAEADSTFVSSNKKQKLQLEQEQEEQEKKLSSNKRRRGGTPSSAPASGQRMDSTILAQKRSFSFSSSSSEEESSDKNNGHVVTQKKARKSLSKQSFSSTSSSDSDAKASCETATTPSRAKKKSGNDKKQSAVIEILDDSSCSSDDEVDTHDKNPTASSTAGKRNSKAQDSNGGTTSMAHSNEGNIDENNTEEKGKETSGSSVPKASQVVQIPTRTTTQVASTMHQTLLTAHMKSANSTRSTPKKAAKASFDRTDDTIDSYIDDSERPINPKAMICWSCTIPLQRNGRTNEACSEEDSNKRNEDDDNGWGAKYKSVGLYSIHAHPLLEISVCSTCSDKAYIIEDEAKEAEEARRQAVSKDDSGKGENDDLTEMEACSLCAVEASPPGEEEGGPTFLCCDSCPRTWCERCVACLNGGGREGRAYVDRVTTIESGKEWLCPSCETPDALDQMQIALVKWSDEGAAIESKREDTDDGINRTMSPESKSVCALIDELNFAEDGLNEAAKNLEDDEIAKHRAEIVAELSSERSDLSEGEIEAEADAEISGLRKKWEDHHSRLCETITTLQEALEVRGVNIAAVYKDREANILCDDGDDKDDGINTPDWVKVAEDELNRRDQEEGFNKGEFRGSSGYKMDPNIAMMDIEDLDQSGVNEIEDINTLEGTLAQLEHISNRNNENNEKSKHCRWSTSDLTTGDIENMRRRALRRDDEDLRALKVDIDTLELRGQKEEDDARKEKKVRRKETGRKTVKGTFINLHALVSMKKRGKSGQRSAEKAQRKQSETGVGSDSGNEKYGTAFSGVQRNRSGPGMVSIQPVSERVANGFRRKDSSKGTGILGRPAKRRVVPQTVLGGHAKTGKNLFSSSSTFSSLTTFDRYGDGPQPQKPKTQTIAFEDSDIFLPYGDTADNANHPMASVSIVKPLADILKGHQVEGVKFLWENLMTKGTGSNDSSGQIRGAILAHNMGLGKSVQLCSFLHTFLAHPKIVEATSNSATSWHGTTCTENHSSPSSLLRSLQNNKSRSALLCVPVNTIANWENEWSKWILTKERGKEVPTVHMFNINAYHSNQRFDVIVEWMKKGGVLLTSDRILANLCKPLLSPPKSKKGKSSTASGIGGLDGGSGTDNDFDPNSTGSRSSSPTAQQKELIKSALLDPGPDVVCLDEGHQFLKNKTTNISRSLHAMTGICKRIVLTGTPLQNNLVEYYRMAKWTSPSAPLGTETAFERNFATPIMTGAAKDATAHELFASSSATQQLHQILAPFVQRRGADVLAKDLPPMQQVVINIRQSKLQQKLYRAFTRYKKSTNNNNFFDQYQKLRPINNHPATLLVAGRDDRRRNGRGASPSPESLPSSRATSPLPVAADQSATSKDKTPTRSNQSKPGGLNESTEECSTKLSANEPSEGSNEMEIDAPTDEEGASTRDSILADARGLNRASSTFSNSEEEKWWQSVYDKNADDFKDVMEGGKIVLLLQILCHADMIGDKCVVFTQCLKTMDFIEEVLNSPDWGKSIPALTTLGGGGGQKWGQWRKNREYLRIDGATSASDRGDLVSSFNQATDAPSEQLENQAKLFLISKEAGGVGINLYAANRVILFDSHWNPAVDLQAIYRCYRYGQTKPVFAYRFLTEGTMEDKIYSRSVNKQGLAARVIDQKHPERAFTNAELTDILATNTMVCCDACDKWRVIPPWAEVEDGEFDGYWECSMNKFDKPRAKCEAKERDQAWYHQYFLKERARRQRKELAKQQRQQQQQEELSQSQEILPSQSQSQSQSQSEMTLYESEMKDSVDTRKKDDPNKSRNITRDVILRRLIYTAGGSKADHDAGNSKKTKKHVTSWISKFHFHESLLQDDKTEKQNLKDAAETAAADAAEMAIAAAASSTNGSTNSKPAPQEEHVSSDDKDKEPAITNSPPPSPESSVSTPKSKKGHAVVENETKKSVSKSKKRPGSHFADDEGQEAKKNKTDKKKTPNKSSKDEAQINLIVHHDAAGHDVFEIIDDSDIDDDTDDDEEADGDGKGVLV